MTMLVCPECKRIVDDSVKNCPGCKYNIRKYVKAAKQGSSTAFLGAITLSSVYDSKEKLPINTPKLEFLSSSKEVVFESPSLSGGAAVTPQENEESIFESPVLNAQAVTPASPVTTSIFDSPVLNAQVASPVTTSIFDSPVLNGKLTQPVAQQASTNQLLFDSPELNGLTTPITQETSIFDSPSLQEKTIFDSPSLQAQPEQVQPTATTTQEYAFESPELNTTSNITQAQTSTYAYNPLLGGNGNASATQQPIFDSPVLNGLALENTNDNSVNTPNPLLGGSYAIQKSEPENPVFAPEFSPLGNNSLSSGTSTLENSLLNGGNPLLGAHNPLLGQSR